VLRIGVRAHDYGRYSADELASKIAASGATCVQLAVPKAIAGLDLKNGDLNPGLAWEVGRAFAKHNVQIAVLGCYINPIHPDLAMRRQSLALFKEYLRYARDFGCSIVGLESGSVNADTSPHPDNQSDRAFDHMLTSIASLVAEAEKFGVIVGFEAVTWHTVSTPARMRKVLDTIKSNNLQVIFDPVNLIDINNWQRQDDVMRESFELLGDRIAIIHAKDFKVEDDKFKQCRTALGSLNYPLLMEWITQRKPGISILFEDVTADTFAECQKYVQNAIK
jgi:L-ribulose-5-phosphate 3-epimerase